MAHFSRPGDNRALQFIAICTAIVVLRFALSEQRIGNPVAANAAADQTAAAAAPVIEELPPSYRDWILVSVAVLGSPVNDIRAKLGNEIAIADFRNGTIPYRDGAIIARLAWRQTRDEQTDSAFELQGRQAGLSPEAIAKLLSGSAVAGPATNVQFMIKDAKKYASTGGWGFAQFTNGKPDPIEQNVCFACHAPAKARDFVFTKYSN